MLTSYAAELEQIVQMIYSTMLNVDMFRVEDPYQPSAADIAARIHITGDVQCTVQLVMSQNLATAAAAAMFRIPCEEVTEQDHIDVATELANMIGGNCKSLLGGELALSLPAAVPVAEFSLENQGQLIDDLSLISEHGGLRVTLSEQ